MGVAHELTDHLRFPFFESGGSKGSLVLGETCLARGRNSDGNAASWSGPASRSDPNLLSHSRQQRKLLIGRLLVERMCDGDFRGGRRRQPSAAGDSARDPQIGARRGPKQLNDPLA